MNKESWHRHIGVYGVCLSGKKLMVVKKNGGPYSYRFDLPGGSIEDRESLYDALVREMKEETGFNVRVNEQLGTFDFLVRAPYEKSKYTHHIAIIYSVTVNGSDAEYIETNIDKGNSKELNDSLGVEFISLNYDLEECSPLVIKIIEMLKLKESSLFIKEYKDWERRECNKW
ncbi:NUDIX hydrolase [Bacillus salitolerans]|uniref:NUDIX hydrolase n=1 Tax=Bacillus salitolerans TaxID=1437434 RepID=A0ABW4LLT5_9BACI